MKEDEERLLTCSVMIATHVLPNVLCVAALWALLRVADGHVLIRGTYYGWIGKGNLGDEGLRRICFDLFRNALHTVERESNCTNCFGLSIVAIHPSYNSGGTEECASRGDSFIIMGGGSIMDDAEYTCALNSAVTRPSFAFGTAWGGFTPPFHLKYAAYLEDLMTRPDEAFGAVVVPLIPQTIRERLVRMSRVRRGGVRTHLTRDLLLALNAETKLDDIGDAGVIARRWARTVLKRREREMLASILRQRLERSRFASFLVPHSTPRSSSLVRDTAFPVIFDRPAVAINLASCKHGGPFQFHACAHHDAIAEALIGTIEHLVSLGWDIVMYAMSKEDLPVIEFVRVRVISNLATEMRGRVMNLKTVPELPNLLALLESASLSIAYRLHGNIFSCAMGTPFVNIAYQWKSLAFMHHLAAVSGDDEARLGLIRTDEIVRAQSQGTHLGAISILSKVDDTLARESQNRGVTRACARLRARAEGLYVKEIRRFVSDVVSGDSDG